MTEIEGDSSNINKDIQDADMPVLITRNMVNFPGVLATVTIARDTTRQLVKYIEKHPQEPFAMFCQKDVNIEEPDASDLCEYGVIAHFLKVFEMPGQQNRYAFIAQSLTRCKIDHVVSEEPFLRAHIVSSPEEIPDEKDIEYNTILADLRKRVAEYMNKSDTIPFELQLSLHSVDSNETFLNMVSYYMPLKLSEKMMLLSCGDFKRRAFELLQILNREIQYANLRLDIQNRTQHVISDEQKQYFLRQQLKSINKELGQQEGEPEKTKLKELARNKHWSDKVKEIFEKGCEHINEI